ncbi:ZIP family metal transporter [Candidatus Gottesmanbacteria bacterium]|nr:ZIP family metal transporter [Candidatus Gottesmanbacteria bacterium]
MLVWILIFTFLGSFASLIGVVLLLWKEKALEGKTLFLVAFAAGAMLSASFLDLIPEALKEQSNTQGVLTAVLVGIVVFFFFERSLLWYHHHSCPEGGKCESPLPTIPLLVIGDSLHNFLDGIVIAGAFLINIPLGVVMSLAVGFHEVPQEIGDFGVFLSLGMKRTKVLAVNIFSALLAFGGAISAFFFLEKFEFLIPYLVAFAAGNFIYIAASDLIPQLHQGFSPKAAISQSLAFLLGILVIFLAIQVFTP